VGFPVIRHIATVIAFRAASGTRINRSMSRQSASWAPSYLIVLALGLGTAAVQCSEALAEPDAERGLAIASQWCNFATQWCNSCHIVQQNDPGMDDGEIGPRFSTLTNQTTQSLKQLLAPGHAGMDALTKLTESDAADLAAHLKRLKPQPATPR
jgi:cytochrome c553